MGEGDLVKVGEEHNSVEIRPVLSVVDLGSVGSKTFSRIRIRKNRSGSGQLRIRNEF